MNCPNCQTESLKDIKTKQGVNVDYCGKCKGVWLAQGKVFKFTKQPEQLTAALKLSASKHRPSQKLSPETQQPMKTIPLLGEKLSVEICPQTKGIWFDDGKLNLLGKAVFKGTPTGTAKPPAQTVEADAPAAPADEKPAPQIKKAPKPVKGQPKPALPPGTLPPLPDLNKYARMPFYVLYGILAVVLGLMMYFSATSWMLALEVLAVFLLAHFVFANFLIEKCVEFFLPMDWIEPHELPGDLGDFIEDLCQKNDMKFPRLGLVLDGTPNIFSYGKGKNSVRLVLTKGLFNLLNKREVEAVIAHELGHAREDDIFFMTALQAYPFILAVLYQSTVQLPEGPGSGKGLRAAEKVPGAPQYFGAFFLGTALSVIQAFNLWFTRARELHADKFAADVTGNPQALASALVKISYGVGGLDKKVKTMLWCDACRTSLSLEQVFEGLCKTCDRPAVKKEIKNERRSSVVEAIGAFGIVDPYLSKAFSSHSLLKVPVGGHFESSASMQPVEDWMQWELDNPWSGFFGRLSTHPMLGLRLAYLAKYSKNKPIVPIDYEKLTEIPGKKEIFKVYGINAIFVLLFLPGLVFFVPWLLGISMVAMGALMLMRLKESYEHDLFPMVKLNSLIARQDMTPWSAEPCKIMGRLLGLGDTKPFGAGEFVVQDDSGSVLLDYRQPHRFWEFVFSLLRGKSWSDQEVRVMGWYRRAPVPYIEVESIKAQGETTQSPIVKAQTVAAWLLLVLGLGLFALAFV